MQYWNHWNQIRNSDGINDEDDDEDDDIVGINGAGYVNLMEFISLYVTL